MSDSITIVTLLDRQRRVEDLLDQVTADLAHERAQLNERQAWVEETQERIELKMNDVCRLKDQIEEIKWAINLIERATTVDKEFMDEVWTDEEGKRVRDS